MIFEASINESKKINDWVSFHNIQKHNGKHPYGGAIGGTLSYTFTPTGLGLIVVVKCMCGEEFNATDFEEW